MEIGRKGRMPVRLGGMITMAVVGGVLLSCAEDARPKDNARSLPALPIEVVEGEQGRLEDYAILGAIRETLWANPRVDRRSVAIDVRRGIVTLTGTVDGANEKRQLLRAAADVEGVQKVVDRIRVREGTSVEGKAEAERDGPTEPQSPTEPR